MFHTSLCARVYIRRENLHCVWLQQICGHLCDLMISKSDKSSSSLPGTSMFHTDWRCSINRKLSNKERRVSHRACHVIVCACNPLPYVFLAVGVSVVCCPGKPWVVHISKSPKDCICWSITFMKFIAICSSPNHTTRNSLYVCFAHFSFSKSQCKTWSNNTNYTTSFYLKFLREIGISELMCLVFPSEGQS